MLFSKPNFFDTESVTIKKMQKFWNQEVSKPKRHTLDDIDVVIVDNDVVYFLGQAPSWGDPGRGEKTSGGEINLQWKFSVEIELDIWRIIFDYHSKNYLWLSFEQLSLIVQVVTMNIKDSLKFGVMIGLLEVHKVVFIS